jgi:hypothetical protein
MPAYQFIFQGAVFSELSHNEAAGRLSELRTVASAQARSGSLHILEWGSGLSTLLLSELVAGFASGSLTTIDHNQQWLNSVLASCQNRTRVSGITADLDGAKDELGKSDDVSYSCVPLHLARMKDEIWQGPWDLIVIDGRRRVECALAATLVSDSHTLIALHDHQRLRYQHIAAFCDRLPSGPHYQLFKAKTFMGGLR